MKLCIGTAKGIVILDPARGATPLLVLADPSPVWCMARDCADPQVIYAGINEAGHGRGVLTRSTDGGRTWTDITPAVARDEEVWALAASPSVERRVFFGASHGRLFRSDDGGRNFFEATAFLRVPGRERWSFPAPPHIPHVRSIAFDPLNSSVIYAGVEVGGVFRSPDGGESFEPLNDGIYADVHALAVDPATPRRLYATTGRGFYVSDNAGASWRRVTTGINRSYTVPLVVAGDARGAIYTAAAAGPPPIWPTGPRGADSALFRSLDHGETFEMLDHGFAPRRGMVMRLRRSSEGSGEIFGVSSDGGVIRLPVGDEPSPPLLIADKLPPAYDLVTLP